CANFDAHPHERNHPMTRNHPIRHLVGVVAAAVLALAASAGAAPTAEAAYNVHMVPMPVASGGGNSMDYIAFDPSTHLVWGTAGSAGVGAVVDQATDWVRRVEGVVTAEMGTGDGKRIVGPSSVTIGEGTVYVGDRADASVCAFDAKTFARGACHKLDSMPDG